MRPAWRLWRVMTVLQQQPGSWHHAAYSHRFAGRACVQAGGIGRARHGAYAFEALINVFDDLIHANEHNNVLRAKREACHAVGVAVDVHELALSVSALALMKKKSESKCCR